MAAGAAFVHTQVKAMLSLDLASGRQLEAWGMGGVKIPQDWKTLLHPEMIMVISHQVFY